MGHFQDRAVWIRYPDQVCHERLDPDPGQYQTESETQCMSMYIHMCLWMEELGSFCITLWFQNRERAYTGCSVNIVFFHKKL